MGSFFSVPDVAFDVPFSFGRLPRYPETTRPFSIATYNSRVPFLVVKTSHIVKIPDSISLNNSNPILENQDNSTTDEEDDNQGNITKSFFLYDDYEEDYNDEDFILFLADEEDNPFFKVALSWDC